MAQSNREAHELQDRPDQAMEEGDPKETGRMQGRIIEDGNKEVNPKPGGQPGEGEHWESGREDAR